MERITDIDHIRVKVLADMNNFINTLRKFVGKEFSSLNDGLAVLQNVRSSVYENLNQIQHEYLILQGILWLSENGFNQPEIVWYWNPRQKGNTEEPDLRATINGKIVLSAEATTSEIPQDLIDSRMNHRLLKLNEMEGTRYYFVRTTSMESRARSKVTGGRLLIKVIKIES
jgi:hypothetical protein